MPSDRQKKQRTAQPEEYSGLTETRWRPALSACPSTHATDVRPAHRRCRREISPSHTLRCRPEPSCHRRFWPVRPPPHCPRSRLCSFAPARLHSGSQTERRRAPSHLPPPVPSRTGTQRYAPADRQLQRYPPPHSCDSPASGPVRGRSKQKRQNETAKRVCSQKIPPEES